MKDVREVRGVICEHREIVMVNCEGKKLQTGGHEVDFTIRCNNCDEDYSV